MSTIETLPQPKESQSGAAEIINDFSIQIATVNGSGSQSSNNILMRSLFQMGIPVSGKNLFPSNIAGLPTWFTIRANKHGYVGCKREIEIVIAMNPETAAEDVAQLAPGSVVIFEERLRFPEKRDDLILYPVPFSKLAAEIVKDARLRKLVANMIYVGTAAEILSIEMAEVESTIAKWFKTKKKAIDFNVKAAHLGAKYARDNLPKRDSFRVERMSATDGKIIIDGNSAAALGCVFAGITVATWYPITPSSSLCESLIDYAERFRMDPDTGKATFVIIQAEDELAAVGMAIGAGWAGARSMTSTSGPGISLMGEFAGLAYFSEVPVVIFDVQRVGPSTGLPTRTSQGDILSLYYCSHGDTKHIVLLPCDMKECFEFARISFDLAERFQQPIFVASDLDLGMNNWMSDTFPYPEEPLDRGKVLTADDLERLKGDWGRYRDVDGDGIPFRTLPGTEHPSASYFTRGSGHNQNGQYSERAEDFANLLDRLGRKHDTARSAVPAPVVDLVDEAKVGLIGYGSTDLPMEECQHQLEREYGLKTSYLRLRALPFNKQLNHFVKAHEAIFCIEQNKDGQMGDLIRLEIGGDCRKVHKILHYDGLPIDARFITDAVVEHQKLERMA